MNLNLLKFRLASEKNFMNIAKLLVEHKAQLDSQTTTEDYNGNFLFCFYIAKILINFFKLASQKKTQPNSNENLIPEGYTPLNFGII